MTKQNCENISLNSILCMTITILVRPTTTLNLPYRKLKSNFEKFVKSLPLPKHTFLWVIELLWRNLKIPRLLSWSMAAWPIVPSSFSSRKMPTVTLPIESISDLQSEARCCSSFLVTTASIYREIQWQIFKSKAANRKSYYIYANSFTD